MRTLLALLLYAAILDGQSTKSELSGVVRDPAGLPVESAIVKLIRTETGAIASITTATDGGYHFVGLPPGNYRLLVSKPRFAPLERTGIVLRVGEHSNADLTLALGVSAETIQVSAAAPLLQTNRGTESFAVDQKKVTALPLDGRNFVPLIALSPGVSLPPGNLLPRINGSRPRTSEYIYDGISVLQPEPGQVAFYPIADAIEEFRVELNSYSAEYGRSNGGVIMVHQKSGSNDLHGTLFEFFRNEKLNARNLFAGTGEKPRFRRNQYGFVLGGPIRKNRTFFFADWQQTRLNTGVVRTSTVPTLGQKRGVFTTPITDPLTRLPFPGNTIPTERFDKAALAVLDRYPAPNLPGVANNYRRLGNDNTVQDQFDGRLDRYFGVAHRLFARYSFLRDDSVPTTPLPDGSGNLTSGLIGATLTRADSIAAEHSWSVTPASVNQLRFGYTRRRFDRSALRTGNVSGIPNLPVSSFSDVMPTYDIVGYQQLGPPANANASFTTSVTQFLDTYSRVLGKHSWKAGADVRLEHLDVLQPPSPTGNFQFNNLFTGNSFASFLLGQVTRFSIDAQPEVIRPRARIAEFFAQDDWRATRRLSLNLGVRYTLNFPSTVLDNHLAVFNLTTQKLDFPRTARNLEKGNFGPRIGLAFQAKNSLAIRAGYGLTWIEQAGITTPFTTPLFPFIQTLGQQTFDNLHPAFVLSDGPGVRVQPPGPDSGLGQGVFGSQRDNGSGYAQQWNFTLQKTFGQNWSVEAGYLGSKLTRLGVPDVNLNQLTVEQLALGAQLTHQVPNPFYGRIPATTSLGAPAIARAQLLRPFPAFTTVALYRNNTGHSTYHAVQVHIEKRFARGLTFTAAYTYSRLIDDAGAVFDSAILTGPVANFQAADSFNKRLEKDVSTGNIPHILAIGFVYERRGWTLAGIARAQSGSPLAVTQATNFNAFAGFGIQRPNRIANPSLPTDQRSTARWFNTAAFTQAPQFSIGNSSRNPVVGPGYRTIDLMAGRTFQVTERLKTEVRLEAFNLTNTPPLGAPNTSFGSPGFGVITTALDPRVFEVAMKLHF